MVADVTKDQFAAGENATPQQRAMRAVGVAAKGVSTIGPVADNEIAKGAAERSFMNISSFYCLLPSYNVACYYRHVPLYCLISDSFTL